MCGICGIAKLNNDDQMDRTILERMNRRLDHRGPDGEGFFCAKSIMLGMRRLSIIDLATGDQPISNEDETVWVIQNGEIYNYRVIRAELEKKGHIFRTESDTEVIVHAYEEYGERCVDHFLGMFALAVWDANHERLFVARDRLGIKPLYYWIGHGQFVFASELKALLAHPEVPRDVDLTALDLFLSLEYVPGPRTIFEGIFKLQPGHSLILQNGDLTLRRYWDIPELELPESMEACREILYALMQDAVKQHLVSDVPLGAFLSGGLDSSTVVALMSLELPRKVETFSIGFEDDSYNELAYARAVAERFGTEHHEEVLKLEPGDSVEELICQFDEPFGDFSIFPTYLVSRMARRSVKVVLSGDGGDEVFGGYDTYIAQSLDGYYRKLPASLRKDLIPRWMARIPPQQAKKGAINKAKRFVEGSEREGSLQHVRWMTFTHEADKQALYRPWLRDRLHEAALEAVFEDHFKASERFGGAGRLQYVDIKTYLVDDILTKVDRMSMAASLEARVPLLDHRVVEFAVNLPSRMKVSRGKTKIILRNIMKDTLPRSVLNKPKQGFSIPIKHWLGTSLKPMMTDLLSADCVRSRGYFEPETVTRWMTEHLEGRANHSHRLWALMVLELWQSNIPHSMPHDH